MKELPEQEYKHYVYESTFDYIEKNVDVTPLQYVATLKGRSQFLFQAYKNLMREAEDLGANCFTFESYKFDEESDREELTIKAFFATEAQLNDDRFFKSDSSTVTIFADDYQNYDLLINDKVVTIPFGHYVQYSLSNLDQLNIENHNKRIIKPMKFTQSSKGLPLFFGLGNMHYNGKRNGGNAGTTIGVVTGGILGGLIAEGINSKMNAVILPIDYGLILLEVKKRVSIK